MLVLTKRAREILLLMVEGLNSKEIGKKLGISGITCQRHIDLAAKKNNTSNVKLLYDFVKEQ